MTARPILFSGPMVRAIRDGRKTRTRRVLKRQPAFVDSRGVWYNSPGSGVSLSPEISLPYRAGDRLWVREPWGHACEPSFDGRIYYMADGDWDDNRTIEKRPSIHMPRWASRITLDVTDVRVQRVREISADDAERKGIWRGKARRHLFWHAPWEPHFIEGRRHPDVFAELWDSLNAKRGHGWDASPWVAAIAFEPVFANIDDARPRPDRSARPAGRP